MELQNLPKIQKIAPKTAPCSGTQRRRQQPHPSRDNTRPRRVSVNATDQPSKRRTDPRSPDRTEVLLHRPLVEGMTRYGMEKGTRTAWVLYRPTGRWLSRMMGLRTSSSKKLFHFFWLLQKTRLFPLLCSAIPSKKSHRKNGTFFWYRWLGKWHCRIPFGVSLLGMRLLLGT